MSLSTKNAIISACLAVSVADICGVVLGQTSGTAMDTGSVERLTGAKGTFDEKDGVFKVSVPRKYLSVVIAGVKMTPPMGLTCWAAFKHDGKDDMMMGDLVLLQDQISPVMRTALDNGLEVTALRNHFVWDSPRIIFMHIGGVGPKQNLASAVGRIFTEIKQTSGKTHHPDAHIGPARSSLDPAQLDSALGVKGQYMDGVYKFVSRANNSDG
jgi:uncharacterized protein DUF1259